MLKMLIAIDSDIFINELECDFCEQYEIHTCKRGNDALQILQKYHPDILIIDLSLPDIPGLAVLQQAEFMPPIIIALTNYLSDRIVREAQAAGVKALIRIPCTLKCIKEHLIALNNKLPSQD